MGAVQADGVVWEVTRLGRLLCRSVFTFFAMVVCAGALIAQADKTQRETVDVSQIWRPATAVVADVTWKNTKHGRENYLSLEFRDAVGTFYSVEHAVSRAVFSSQRANVRRTIWYDPADPRRVAIAEDRIRTVQSVLPSAATPDWNAEQDGMLTALGTVQSRRIEGQESSKRFILEVAYQDRDRVHRRASMEVSEPVYQSKPRLSYISIWYDPDHPEDVRVRDLPKNQPNSQPNGGSDSPSVSAREIVMVIASVVLVLSIWAYVGQSKMRVHRAKNPKPERRATDIASHAEQRPFSPAYMIWRRGGFWAIVPLCFSLLLVNGAISISPRTIDGPVGSAIVMLKFVSEGSLSGSERTLNHYFRVRGTEAFAQYGEQLMPVDKATYDRTAKVDLIKVVLVNRSPPQMMLVKHLGELYPEDFERLKSIEFRRWMIVVCAVLIAVIFRVAASGVTADIRAREQGVIVKGRIKRVEVLGRLNFGFLRCEIIRILWADNADGEYYWTRRFLDFKGIDYRQGDAVRGYGLGKHVVWEGDVGAAEVTASSIPVVSRK